MWLYMTDPVHFISFPEFVEIKPTKFPASSKLLLADLHLISVSKTKKWIHFQFSRNEYVDMAVQWGCSQAKFYVLPTV